MGVNRIQFQPGLSLEQFLEYFGTEENVRRPLSKSGDHRAFSAPNADMATTELFMEGATSGTNAKDVVIRRPLLQAR
jgi:hypothetical protein